METYDSLIDPVYIRDRVTLYAESPAIVADKICRAKGISGPQKSEVLRRVSQLVVDRGWEYVPVSEQDIRTRIRSYRAGRVKVDPEFIEHALVDVMELSLPTEDSPGDLKTLRATIRDLGALKQVNAFVTSSSVEMTVKGGLNDLSLEEKQRLLEDAIKSIPHDPGA
jgi:hypothetical protein